MLKSNVFFREARQCDEGHGGIELHAKDLGQRTDRLEGSDAERRLAVLVLRCVVGNRWLRAEVWSHVDMAHHVNPRAEPHANVNYVIHVVQGGADATTKHRYLITR